MDIPIEDDEYQDQVKSRASASKMNITSEHRNQVLQFCNHMRSTDSMRLLKNMENELIQHGVNLNHYRIHADDYIPNGGLRPYRSWTKKTLCEALARYFGVSADDLNVILDVADTQSEENPYGRFFKGSVGMRHYSDMSEWQN